MTTLQWNDLLFEAEEYDRLRSDGPSFFIAHLLSQVLVGQIGDNQDYLELRQAAEKDEIWELHIFNKQREVYAVWEEQRVVRYANLEHRSRDKCPDDIGAEYRYELEPRYAAAERNPAFNQLVVRVYWENDETDECAIPRVGQTVLYELRGGAQDGGAW